MKNTNKTIENKTIEQRQKEYDKRISDNNAEFYFLAIATGLLFYATAFMIGLGIFGGIGGLS